MHTEERGLGYYLERIEEPTLVSTKEEGLLKNKELNRAMEFKGSKDLKARPSGGIRRYVVRF